MKNWPAETLNHSNAAGAQARVVWLTGLSGAGKTTIGAALLDALRARGRPALLLDGDVMRRGLCADLDYSDAARRENVRRLGEVARLVVEGGIHCVVAAISPFRADREAARLRIGPARFHEVFVDVPLAVAEARDVKGLYAAARRGELAGFTGVSAPYEAPLAPALHLRTDTCSPAAALASVLGVLGLPDE